MKKYEQILKIMIRDFAEDGLIKCFNKPDIKIIDYLNYMGIVVVRSNEQENPKFILDVEIKEKITSIVEKQWNLFKETKTGSELLSFYMLKPQMEEVLKNPEKLDNFLISLSSKKMLNELFFAFVKLGDLNSVKKLVEKKSPNINPDVDVCVVAVEHNQPAILDYLLKKDKYQVKNQETYMGIYTRKSMEYDSPDVFNYTIEKCFEKENLLNHAIFFKLKDYAYKLIDLGAKIEGVDSRVDKSFLDDVTSYYNKKLLNDNLEYDLINKPKSKSTKI